MDLAPGDKLGGYEIVALVGAGGMGQVYRARDTRLGRDVAIKLLLEGVSDDPDRRARFDREARTLAALNHPGIVTIFAVEHASDRTFIAMEWVDGTTLADVVARRALPLGRLLSIAAQVASAVAAAHKHGIVHRDIKPANIIVGSQDRVKVLDFGLAKLRGSPVEGAETVLPKQELTGQGRILGTVAYMSPEQAESQEVDGRSDVFSLGVMLYEMATGERPFKGDTSLSVLSAILRETPRPLSAIAPSLPREFGRIVKRCLAKDPDERYQSAVDLRNDIEDLRQSESSGDLHAPAIPKGGTRSTGWMVAAGVILAVLTGVGWAVTRARPSPQTTLPQLSFSRLTLLEGVSSEPVISPDGKWVVYVSSVSGNQDIYLQSTTGQTAINLTKDSPLADRTPAFSPDGELIAFRSERDGGGLFVMGRTGESVRRLTRMGYQPAWFPDGRQIAFASVLVNNAEARGGDLSELWVVDVSGGEPHRLTQGDAVQPRVSPNGRRIAFWAMPSDPGSKNFAAANRDVWTVSVDGSNPVPVTTESATDWNPVWSPDGRWLYFLSNRSGSMNLWRVPIDEATGVTTGAPQSLAVPASYIRHFSLSADGRLGAYAAWAVTSNLARVAFDTRTATVTGAVQAITTGPRDFNQLDVNRNHSVALVTNPRLQEDLFVVEGDGSGLRNVTNDAFRDRAPHWSVDGRQILFYSDRGKENYEIWSIDRDGSALRQLTSTGGRRFFPVPSRDGGRHAASDITAGAHFVYDGRDYSSPAQQLPPLPAEFGTSTNSVPLDWSSDGTLLSGQNGVIGWVYSFEKKTYKSLGPAGQTAQFLPDGRRLIVTRQGRLVTVDWMTGAERPLLAIPGEIIVNARLSPDGSFLYFLHGEQSGDIWIARFDSRDDTSPTASRP
jgi:serine/threonine protein kinase